MLCVHTHSHKHTHIEKERKSDRDRIALSNFLDPSLLEPVTLGVVRYWKGLGQQ